MYAPCIPGCLFFDIHKSLLLIKKRKKKKKKLEVAASKHPHIH